jgi:hypothetical protein
MRLKKINARLGVLRLMAPICVSFSAVAQDDSAPDVNLAHPTSPQSFLTVDNGDGTTTTTTIMATTATSTNEAPAIGNGNITDPSASSTIPSNNRPTSAARLKTLARAQALRPSLASGIDQATTVGNPYTQQQQQLNPEDAQERAGHPAIYWILIVFAIIGGIYYAIESSSPRKL